MFVFIRALLIAGLLTSKVQARDVPTNIQALYNSIRAKGSCSNVLKGGFYSQEKDTKDFCYCGDHLASDNIMYLQGTHGKLVNMDIDCDGTSLGGGADRSCDSSADSLIQTRFRDIVESYGKGIRDLSTYIHSFVVLGNEGKRKGYVDFDPQSIGVEPLSIVAVVCGDKLFYGVWGDVNLDDSPPLVGEVSESLGRACYGDAVNGGESHDDNDILYIAFSGHGAVPGASGAQWNAKTFEEFEASLQTQGDKLIAKIGRSSSHSFS